MPRHAALQVDLSAISHNVRTVASFAPDSMVCAVVKADGYGHGAVQVARAALTGGAEWLAVALVEEGVVLRDAGIDAPILLLSEQPSDAMADALAARLTPTVYSVDAVAAARDAVRAQRSRSSRSPESNSAYTGPWLVHLKVDTGMHRVGADPSAALSLASLIGEAPELALGGTFTHLAVADEPERPETVEQLETFQALLKCFADAGIDPGIRHAANSAGVFRHPDSHMDMVRAGIAIYGYAPSSEMTDVQALLQPALALNAEVSMVRELRSGDAVSYGLRHVFDHDVTVAVVPVGYADGIDRRFGMAGGVVLIGGSRCPVRGVVTMDQFVVEVGPDVPVRCGDEVVLLGTQAGERVHADEWADRLGTISYEVLCRFSDRLPRSYVGTDRGPSVSCDPDPER